MPTWGWFIVALVLIDVAVLAAWFLARKNPRKNPSTTDRAIVAGLDDEARGEIYRLVGEKKKIQAIKLFRERTGSGLKEAKDVVESVELGNPLPGPSALSFGTESTPVEWEDIIPRLRALKREGQTIAAIKLLRSRTGLPLREAKEAMDRL
jgi:ribosomal protein L7/L12